MTRRVLVTRPEPGASATAKRLSALGFEAVVLPLSQIEPLAVTIAADRIDAVAVTSANAVRCAPGAAVKTLESVPIFAVGEATAEAARQAGLQVVWTGREAAASLARELTDQLTPDANVLYLAGRVRRPEFEMLLADAGLRITVAESYDTTQISYSTEYILDVLSHRPIESALLYSAVAAGAIAGYAVDPRLFQLFENTTFFCISDRVAAALPLVRGSQLVVASEPREEDLLSCLRK